MHARIAYPMVFWPGPLEGGSRLQPLPEALSEDLDRAFAEETPNIEALTLLANLAAMFAIPDDLVDHAVARIRAAGPRLLALIPTERVYAQLLGLAHVAASHRAEHLADVVQVLARVAGGRRDAACAVRSRLAGSARRLPPLFGQLAR